MSNSIINRGLRADVMRKRMEDKNTLQHKGALYVGTGTSSTTTVDGVTFTHYHTTELYPGEGEFNLPLVADSSATLGVKFSQLNGSVALVDKMVNTDLITRHTINHDDLTLHNFPVSFLGSGNIINSSSGVTVNGIAFRIVQASDTNKFHIYTAGGTWKNATTATRATSLTASNLVGSDSRWRYPTGVSRISSYIAKPFSQCLRNWTSANKFILAPSGSGGNQPWTSPWKVKYLRNVLKIGMILKMTYQPDSDNSHNFDIGCWPGACGEETSVDYSAFDGRYWIPLTFSVNSDGYLVIGIDTKTGNWVPQVHEEGANDSSYISYIYLAGVTITYSWNVVPTE